MLVLVHVGVAVKSLHEHLLFLLLIISLFQILLVPMVSVYLIFLQLSIYLHLLQPTYLVLVKPP